MIRRVLALTVKELLQLRRDWRTALALLGMPVAVSYTHLRAHET